MKRGKINVHKPDVGLVCCYRQQYARPSRSCSPEG